MDNVFAFFTEIKHAIHTNQTALFTTLLSDPRCNTLIIFKILTACVYTPNSWYLRTLLSHATPQLDTNDILITLHSAINAKAPPANIHCLLQFIPENILKDPITTAGLLSTAINTNSLSALSILLNDPRIDPSVCNNAALECAQEKQDSHILTLLRRDHRVQLVEIANLNNLLEGL